jgi:hypothetical protein
MSALLEIAESLIAGGTLAAAWFAKLSADSSAKAMQAQLYSDLIQSYDMDVMSNALRELANWRAGRAADFDTAVKDWAREQASERPSPACLELDRKRSFVSHFYHKASRLIEGGMLQAGLKDEIVALFGKQVMHDVVLPMDRAAHTAQKSPARNAMEQERRFLRAFFAGEAVRQSRETVT